MPRSLRLLMLAASAAAVACATPSATRAPAPAAAPQAVGPAATPTASVPAETTGLSLQRLSYKEGELSLSLMIGDLQRLEQLKSRLTSTGHLSIEIQSANTRDNQVEARLQIKGGKS